MKTSNANVDSSKGNDEGVAHYMSRVDDDTSARSEKASLSFYDIRLNPKSIGKSRTCISAWNRL